MSTFVLVHGAWHGAWCWDRLVPELAARGHHAIAMDLPAEDATATLERYAQAVIDAVPTEGNDVILVGHSLGGMTIPVVASRRNVKGMIFLCGIVPNLNGNPWDDSPPMEDPGAYDAIARTDDGSTYWPDIGSARAALYADCTPEDVEWAFARIRPQNSTSIWDRPFPLTAWPDCARASIYTAQDAAVAQDWSRYVARERLGVDAMEIPGSHSPFISRPAELADSLSLVAATF